jgi:Nucleotidyltransferase domain
MHVGRPHSSIVPSLDGDVLIALASTLEPLTGDLRTELLRRIRSRIAGWPVQPLHASLFGSAARADGNLDSDIDLLIVSPRGSGDEDEAWCAQVHRPGWRL